MYVDEVRDDALVISEIAGHTSRSRRSSSTYHLVQTIVPEGICIHPRSTHTSSPDDSLEEL